MKEFRIICSSPFPLSPQDRPPIAVVTFFTKSVRQKLIEPFSPHLIIGFLEGRENLCSSRVSSPSSNIGFHSLPKNSVLLPMLQQQQPGLISVTRVPPRGGKRRRKLPKAEVKISPPQQYNRPGEGYPLDRIDLDERERSGVCRSSCPIKTRKLSPSSEMGEEVRAFSIKFRP